MGLRYDAEIPEANRFQLPMLFAYLQSLKVSFSVSICRCFSYNFGLTALNAWIVLGFCMDLQTQLKNAYCWGRFFIYGENNCFPKCWEFSVNYVLSFQVKLGLIIDLTNTSRFYDKAEVENSGIGHVKLRCQGLVVIIQTNTFPL